jgi:hypothetical protein
MTAYFYHRERRHARNGVCWKRLQRKGLKDPGRSGVLFSADTLGTRTKFILARVHSRSSPALDCRTLVPSVQNRVAIRIADGEFLDYLNACARLRTQRVKVELLVELSLL